MITFSSAFAVEQSVLSPSRANELWESYKSGFIQKDGRVIDKHQNWISHSESQGYGMLICVIMNDKASFDAIWRWTQDNLQSRKDSLFPWAWGKRHNGQYGVIDYNNATDGDVLIGYALVKAAVKWNVPTYKASGLKIIEGMRNHLYVQYDGKSFLLPAYYGFQKEDGLVLNPSYLIFSAYRLFSEIDNKALWDNIYKDSLFLIGKGTFGKWKLPPDWVVLRKSGIAIWDEKAPLFAYESIRTILYLSWEKSPTFPEGLNDLFKFHEKNGFIPVSVDLLKNQISLEEAPAGFYAIYARAAEKIGRKELSRQLWTKALEKAEYEKESYYSMSLLLLALHNDEK
jgi:endoglucanase